MSWWICEWMNTCTNVWTNISTNPKDAAEGTIRKKFGISIDKNSVHGSDSAENAKIEIDFFFKS